MRELERLFTSPPAHGSPTAATIAVVGRGRLGTALTRGLRDSGVDVSGPLGRDADLDSFDAVVLCVPDAAIAAAAARVPARTLVGHCAGACTLAPLAPHEGFSLHPLMTFTAQDGRERFAGAGAAIAGSTPRARELATALAKALGMRPFEVADEDRAAYHAAASIASNFLVTLEAAAERVGAGTGLERELLAPLVLATVENWSRLGPEQALTGPIARGDRQTVVRQRDQLARRAPELLELFDVLVERTRSLATAAGQVPGRGAGGGASGGARSGASGGAHRGARAGAGMRTVESVAALRESLAEARRAGQTIGLVPTMGALHEGHLALMRCARAECDIVVVSLFVNPSQFNDPGDLEAYPRDQARDVELAAAAGVDYLFVPAVDEVYPAGFATEVSVAGMTEKLEGASRGRGHFNGVTTVVTKLLNMVGPDVAYFGQKDAQQAIVIRRLVADLNLPVRIAVCPTVRDRDGLALSSRNARLSPDQRARAAALPRALQTVAAAIAAGETDPATATAAARHDLMTAGVELEYLELVSPDTLDPISHVDGEVLAVLAARVGTTRLIDNTLIQPRTASPDGSPAGHRTTTAAASGRP